MTIESKAKWLKRHNYAIKHTEEVGWWVDGACGYAVAYYFSKRAVAINTAYRRIKEVIKAKSWPSWRTS